MTIKLTIEMVPTIEMELLKGMKVSKFLLGNIKLGLARYYKEYMIRIFVVFFCYCETSHKVKAIQNWIAFDQYKLLTNRSEHKAW